MVKSIRLKKNWTFLFFLFLLRLPSFFEPYWYGDEGITLTVGQQIAQGAVLYKEITDNKPPLLYFLAAIVGDLTYFKVLTFFWAAASFYFFLKLRKIFKTHHQNLTVIIFLVLTSTPILEGNIVNGEIYMLLPALVSIYLFWQRKYFLSGFFTSLAFLFKVPAAFDFFLLLTFAFFQKKFRRRDLSLLVLGFFLPFTPLLFYFTLKQALSVFFQEVFLNNFLYSSSWKFILQPHLWLSLKVSLLLFFLFYLQKKKKKFSQEEIFLYLWLIFSLFAATLSNRPYPHYLLQVVPPFSLLLGKKWRKINLLFLGMVFFFVFLQFKIGFGSFAYLFSYYRHFQNPFFFDEKQLRVTYEINNFLQAHSKKEERIFVFADNSLIYALSKRKPATRFVAAYHFLGNKKREEEVRRVLRKSPPRFIIILLPAKPFPALEEILVRYNLKRSTFSYLIYETNN